MSLPGQDVNTSDVEWSGHASWDATLASLPEECQDIFFTSSFHSISAGDDLQPSLTVLECDGEKMLVGGMRARISLWWDDDPATLYDLQQPCVGYGGPVGTPGAMDPLFLAKSWRKWKELQKEQNVVAAYFRLHPLLENQRWLPADATVEFDRPSVFLDLRGGFEEFWRRASSQFRNMVRKAEKANLQIMDDDDRCWRDFQKLYAACMERLHAAPGFRYGGEFFERLRALPQCKLLGVARDEQLLAGVIYLRGSRWLHYHLAARDATEGNHLSSYLIFRGAQMALADGKDGLFLYSAVSRRLDDPLLIFKKRTGGRVIPVHMARVIIDPTRFEHLVTRWKQASGRQPRYLLGYREPFRLPETAGTDES